MLLSPPRIASEASTSAEAIPLLHPQVVCTSASVMLQGSLQSAVLPLCENNEVFLTVHCALRCSRKDNSEPTTNHSSFYPTDFFFLLSVYFVLGTGAGINYPLVQKPVITVIAVLLETIIVCACWEMVTKQLNAHKLFIYNL